MFRMLESNLEKDPTYPADLKELGYFINDAGQIRMIEYPDKCYMHQYSNIDRHNEVYREAMQVCQRNEVEKRLSALGLEKLHVPQLTTTKPEGEPSTAILAPPPEVLKKRKRIIVLINDSVQDLGILSYGRLQRDLGLNGGSVVNFAKEIFKRAGSHAHEDQAAKVKKFEEISKDGAEIPNQDETPGLIVLNCGQLLYSYKLGKALTTRSWTALPRKSIYHGAVQIAKQNHIEGNHNAEEHIKFVLKNVIENDNFVAKNAEIYVIGIENGAETLLEILGKDETHCSRISAMALINPFVAGSQITNPALKSFLHSRARQWKINSGSTNPRECVEVPHRNTQDDVEIVDSSKKDSASQTINWLETLSPLAIVIETIKYLSPFKLTSGRPTPQLTDANNDLDPICPTFASGPDNPYSAGECVFTDPEVQRSVLDYFEEVAQNPGDFHNPTFKPTPVPSAAQEWDDDTNDKPSAKEDAAFQPLQPAEISPEQAELDEKREKLANMRKALEDTPHDSPALLKGITNLQKRITKTTEEIDILERKALGAGGLKAGDAEKLRENWKPEKHGQEILFAGVKVGSELVKGAGLVETAEVELAKLD